MISDVGRAHSLSFTASRHAIGGLGTTTLNDCSEALYAVLLYAKLLKQTSAVCVSHKSARPFFSHETDDRRNASEDCGKSRRFAAAGHQCLNRLVRGLCYHCRNGITL